MIRMTLWSYTTLTDSAQAGALTKADQASTSSDRTNTTSGDSKVRPR